MKSIRSFFSYLLCSLLSIQPICALQSEKGFKDLSTYSQISQQYLPNFGSLEEALLREQLNVVELNEYEKRQVVLGVFDKYAKQKNHAYENILHRNAWKDLNLFESVSDDESVQLMSIINNTQTVMGEVKLAQMLTKPITDMVQLQKRQTIIKEFINNESLAKDLELILVDLKRYEESFLSFWRLRDEAKFDRVYFMQEMFKKNNTSAVALESSTRVADLLTVGYLPIIFGINLCAKKNRSFIKQYNKYLTKENIKYFYSILIRIWNNLSPADKLNYLKKGGFFVFMICIALGAWGLMIYQEHLAITQIQTVRKKMYNVSEFVFSMDDLAKRCAQSSILSGGIDSFSDNGNILDVLCQKHSGLKTVVGHLKSSSVRYTGYLTHFITPVGRALASYKMMKKEGHNFAAFLDFVGELDAYLSMAKWYKKSLKSNNAKVCFAQFIKADMPSLSIAGMWNPFIDQDNVITNDVAIGQKFGTPNMIVTGPNAGGKSTVLKGIILNVLLAQTFGISCASEMIFTPYSKICTHLNIIDQSGIKSLFQAEVGRAQELIHTVKDLEEGKFSLTIMDEVFNGTNPTEGEAAAFSIGSYISQFSNSNCIIATHFPRLTLLPEYTDNKFQNFKVYVNMLKGGAFTYPYKFVSGTADQRIAIDILQAEGFDTKILELARDIIDNPDKYQVDKEG